MTSASRDWILDLPLAGSRLIEASAGTGKTFTLTAWMLRLLLEADAALPNILAVTFTRAATTELRERVRRRLRGAARLLDGTPPGDEETEQSARIIEQARQRGRSPAQLRAQLQTALLQLDEASIFTIHGFCQRALHEFGFLAGDLNDDPLLDHPAELWQHVAADLWRRRSHAGAEEFERLSALWKTPEALTDSLPKLCDVSRRLLPPAQASAMAHWLHRLRADAIGTFEQALSARRRRTQDQLIEHAWRASAQARFAAALHRRWHWLLVDEFQDTDPRQWDIFRRMHEAKIEQPAGLFLIGDPKQAIYRFRGGDLPTYLRARVYVAAREASDAVHSLQINYRSRPSVLRAVETLFESSAEPFGDPRILFHPVRAARDDDDAFLLAGRPAPGLTLHRLASGGNDKFKRSGKHGQAAAAAVTAAEIVRALEHGTLRTRAGERRVQPDDIAVLVRKNDQIDLVRQALTAAGVATASQSSGNVFESEAATDMRWLMRALAAPGSDRLYTALSTRLLGMDAAQIAALENDAARQAQWLDRFERAATTWQQRGPLPALLPFLTEVSPARLAERGGARLLTDALHLLELLQAQASSQHGLHGLLHWFESHCERRSPSDEHRLRLDTDAQAVRVGTLHKSKGLEYPIVFLPFAAFSTGGGRSGLRFMQVHDGDWPAYYVSKSDGAAADRQWILRDDRHEDREREEQLAERNEELRLLYVGLTRAQYALHVVWGVSRAEDFNGSALRWLLHGGQRGGSKKGEVKPEEIDARIDRLAADSGGSIAVRDVPDPMPASPPLRPPPETVPPPAPRTATRLLPEPSGQYSFSSLRTHHRELLPVRGADDEAATGADLDEDRSLSGPDFGNAVHDALETADFGAWRNAVTPPPQEIDRLREALQRRGLPQSDNAMMQAGALVARALNTPLPGIAALAELTPGHYVREMEFHFRLGAVRLPRLFERLARHGYPRAYPASRRERIEGLMHGYIDLIYRDREGRYFVVDYKTNRLPDYSDAALTEAIRGHDYDLQYLIYLVAVQRWLKLRFGDRYDGERQLGGAVYLFLRGLKPGDAAAGAYCDRPPQALIDRLDHWFDGGEA